MTSSVATVNGGGIYNAAGGNLTVTNSTIAGNDATNRDGGGIYNAGTVTVINSTVPATPLPVAAASGPTGSPLS